MTSVELTSAPKSKESSTTGRFDTVVRNCIGWLEAIVDRANPIMVKETRQALKSRQFILTFFLVLIACWAASFAVVAIVGPAVYYVAEGPRMLSIYFGILAFPLMLIVPFTAFRSLAVEQEDNTYELLSISALTTGQIVTGKLGSAVVQMIVYLSAVSPCIAFTFLLRGVDALTVALLLFYFVLTSLGLSMLALLAGTVAQKRFTQVFLSVLLILCFAYFFVISIFMVELFIQESYQFVRSEWFWIGNLAFLTFFVTTFALIRAAAAAQIAFPSENRSTPLRRIMIVQHACFLGWMVVPNLEEGGRFIGGTIIASASVLGIYWYVMGTMLTSEWPYLSRRVQRSLPQSKAGQMFLTWINPGPGTGYMFCVANVSMTLVLGLGLLSMFSSVARASPAIDEVFYFLILGWSYVVIFLGVGRLLIGLARRFIFVSMTAGVLLHVILMLAAIGLPQIFDYLSDPRQFAVSYSLLHISNPIWTLALLLDQGPSAIDAVTLSLMLVSFALVVLLLNIRTIWGEIQHQRRALPARVIEEEAELHPEPEPKPQSPWEN